MPKESDYVYSNRNNYRNAARKGVRNMESVANNKKTGRMGKGQKAMSK